MRRLSLLAVATVVAGGVALARPQNGGGPAGEGGAESAAESAAWNVRSYRSTVKGLVESSLVEGRAYETLRELCRVAPKRLAGSKGFVAAVAWAHDTMKAMGFENVRLEPVMVPHWERGDVAELTVVAPEGRSPSLPITALGGSVGTPKDGLRAEVIEVGSIGRLRALGEAARGKIVFFNRPMNPRLVNTFQAYGGAVRQRTRGAAEAAKVGAVAAIVRSMTTRLDDAPHTGAMLYEDGVEKVPAVAVSTLGADRLHDLLAAGDEVVLSLKLDARWLDDVASANVIGELTGRERPDEVVVVGGHLDAWDLGEGAHDDGAGCAQSIEVVRLLRAAKLRPRRTIRVVLFANEENGLRGGRQYFAAHEDEMSRHVMALESDRGGFTPRGFTTNANPEAKAVLESIAALLANAGAGKVYGGGGGADISLMGPSGVVLVGYLPDRQRYFDIHHSRYDTFANVNERELELGAACMAAMCYIVADRPDPLPRNGAPRRPSAPK